MPPTRIWLRFDHQVMGGDRARDVARGTCDIVDAVARGDVLERHLQFRDALAERLQHGFEEHLLAVKDVEHAGR